MSALNKVCINNAGSSSIFDCKLFHVCSKCVGKFCLSLLHYLYTCYSVLESSLYTYYNVVSCLRTRSKAEVSRDISLIKSRVSQLRKLPKHLTIIIGEESLSYQDFVKMIVWSISSGISHISFYDHHNGIDCKLLFKYICKYAKEYIPFIKWGKSFTNDIKKKSVTQINGYTWRPLITVHVYLKEDSSNSLLRTVPDLLLSSELTPLSVQQFDTVIRKYLFAPDPDLAVICSFTTSYFGFPQWSLRITQMIRTPTHHNLRIGVFLEFLEGYSKCEQRYGK